MEENNVNNIVAAAEKALFLQIVAGMKELVHLVWEAKPASQ